jgi:hypothetical protein
MAPSGDADLTDRDKSSYPLAIPKCSAEGAWKVAMDSGVPAKVGRRAARRAARSDRGGGEIGPRVTAASGVDDDCDGTIW